MGWKKARDVSDGTWLRLVELDGRASTEAATILPCMLALLLCCAVTFFRSGVILDHPVLEDIPVRALPGLDPVPTVTRLLLLPAALPGGSSLASSIPSSDAISVIRDDIMLGGPAIRGKPSASWAAKPRLVELSRESISVGQERLAAWVVRCSRSSREFDGSGRGEDANSGGRSCWGALGL